MKRHRIVAAGAIAALLLVAITAWASPYWELRQLRAAAGRHDGDAVSAHVDFPALRDSVKTQLAATVHRELGGTSGETNPIAGFGQAVALAFLDPMVDALVSPAGVIAMLENGKVNLAKRRTPAESEHQAQKDADGKPKYAVGYRSWDTFVLTWTASDGSLVFKRHGLWGWKLSGIELASH
jgi:hypothetical protein